MPTIEKILDRVNKNKPNAFDKETLVRWIAELDGRVAADVMLMGIEEIAGFEYEYPGDLTTAPLVCFPHDRIYELWLEAQIDFGNGEYDKYQNTMEYFNAAYGNFIRWFAGRYHPVQGRPGDVAWGGYYITAYGLALKQGYQGTLDEWIASLKGEKGEKGDRIELRYFDDKIHWRWVPEDSETAETVSEDQTDAQVWQDLIDVASIRGDIIEATLNQAKSAANYADQMASRSSEAASTASAASQLAGEAAADALVQAGKASDEAIAAHDYCKRAEVAAAAAAEAVVSVGDLEDLETEDKSSLVAAINEVAHSGGNGGGAGNAETDPTVPAWAKQPTKPAYTASEVHADPEGTGAAAAAAAVSFHNQNGAAHNDLRIQVETLAKHLKSFFDTDDTTMDQLSEIVAYINSNKSLIDAITASKVSVTDIIDNLVTNVASRPLSAAQGVVLKAMIDTLASGKLDASKLEEAVNSALAQAKGSGEFDGKNGVSPIVKATQTADGVVLNIHDVNGTTSATVPKGQDGISPHIGTNGNWYIGNTDTGVKAAGAKGDDGKGIQSVERTSGTGAAGSTDTYTITYTDGSTSTYTVVNGKDGTSVTVSKVTESTADGGSNVVEFSDGKTLTVKNGKAPVKGTDYWTEADKAEIVEEVKDSGVVMYTEQSLTDDQKAQARANIGAVTADEVKEIATVTESIPSPNLVNINDTESWPFGISETEAVKGLYSWVDSDGYIHIKGTATERCSLFLLFDSGNTNFEPGTYYIGFDDVLRKGSQNVVISWNGTQTYCKTDDDSPSATVIVSETLNINKVDVEFDLGAVVDFKGHCWITKDKPIAFYVQKGGSYKVPVVPAKKEDIEKLDNNNILGIFDSIGGVGDSLTSGYINPTSETVGNDTTCYSKSWLSQVKKIVGVDVSHYSYQGATAKNWLQNQNGFYDKILESPHEAYFLALGTNDASDWSGYDLGTIADMGTDSESFYGYYSKVIARIREANPKAPIFMLSHYWTGFTEYDNAIKAMSEATENAYYVDISDMDELYPQYRQGYHFNAIGYYYIAQNIIKRVSEVIVANYQDFANLGVIGTGTDDGSGDDTGDDSGTTTPSYTNVLDTVGYTANKRLGSDGTERDNNGTYLTGYIPCACGDNLYLKNIAMKPEASANYACYIGFYDANKAKVHTASLTTGDSSLYTLHSDGNIASILVDPYRTGTAFMRIVAATIDDTSIITVNEPID